ncbi:MAG: HdeD family acid-resistance protein [Candidatus Nanopelagicales bacterium]|nr:HdeD family acid-resistance protein [Candidatus Nanopelagicales bacterium]MDZ4249953.1 HdeD family acid-resistance protein [Candidatus Nanopelagicales bacterium]
MSDFVPPEVAQAPSDAEDLLERVGKHWWLFLAFGLVSLGVGVAVVVWPAVSVEVVAILLGAWLLVSGVFSLVASLAATGEVPSARVLAGVVGALSILLGVLCFRGIFQAIEILALFVGLGWLMRGIFELISSLQDREQAGRGLTILLAVLSIVAGIVVLVWPGMSLLALAWISGIWLVVLGVFQIVNAFRIKSLDRSGAPS